MIPSTTILPIRMMGQRLNVAKEDSDTSLFYDLMLLGEFAFKLTVISLIAGLNTDKERHQYRLSHKIVRADGMGEWSAVLDEILIGVPSQFLQPSILQFEHKELNSKCESGEWQYEFIESLVDIFPLVGLDPVQLSKKVSGRLWFSYFAQLRNGTKAHGALKPSEAADASRLLIHSILIFLENFSLFKREWVYLYQNLNGRYRVTDFGYSGISHFQKLKSDPSFVSHFPNGVYIFFDRITSVELIQSDAEGADFFLPNGNFREAAFELLSYLTNTRNKGNSGAYLTPAGELPKSETEGLGELDLQGKVFGNIPPTPDGYIHRNELESELLDVLSQTDRYPLVTLLGSGGVGKTTLALTALHRLSEDNRFDVILWFSSRDVDLKMEGAKHVKNSILSERDLADEYTRLMGDKSAIKTAEKLSVFSKALNDSSTYRTLFVLDNFETVANPLELFKWIDTFVRNPNKVLITSRISKSFKADYPVEVKGMQYNEGIDLINNTASKLGILSFLTDQVKDKIFDEAQGHPYVMKILLGQMARDQKYGNVERIMAGQEEILIALFKRTYTTLSPAAKRIFLTLCSWRSTIPVVALEAVMLRDDQSERFNVDDTIEELRRSSFIELSHSDKDQYAFISVPLAAFMFGRGELEVSPMKMAIYSDKELLQEYGAMQQSDISNGIKPKIERKFRAVANKVKGSENLAAHLPTLEYLCRAFPFAWNYLYELQIENGNFSDAESALREYLKTDLSIQEKRSALSKLVYMNRFAKDYLSETTTLIDICTLPDSTLDEVSDIANSVNNYLYGDEYNSPKLILDSDIKQNLIQKLSEIFVRKINGGHSTTATDYSRLVWLYFHLRDFVKAKEVAEKGLLKDHTNVHIRKLAIKLNLM